jgi:GNAT superfamily N-acetyltransferase
VSGVSFPLGFSLQVLRRAHPRREFKSGEKLVDDWLATKALQQQNKHLAVTKVLLDPTGLIAGYYTLATGQVAFDQLPVEIATGLPKRLLPVAWLAWLGVDTRHQGQRLGQRLLAQALADCYYAGQTFPFVAVVLDCLHERVKEFYERWNFRELPSHPLRLYLSATELDRLMNSS